MTGEGERPEDTALRAALARVVAAADPVPPSWRQVALDAFDGHDRDAALAEVAYESAATPGPGGARRVGWTLPGDGTLDVELVVGADGVRVRGRLWPPGVALVLVRWPGGAVAAAVDPDGDFRIDDLPRRPLSFVLDGDRPTRTGWLMP